MKTDKDITRMLADIARRFDASFLVTLIVIAILCSALWVVINVARDVVTSVPNSPYIGLVNGDFGAFNAASSGQRITIRPTPQPTFRQTVTPSPSVASPSPTKMVDAGSIADPSPTTGRILGVVRHPASDAAVLREQPNSSSRAMIFMSNGEQVEVLQVVVGEALEADSTEWYQVRFLNISGYVYGRYIERIP